MGAGDRFFLGHSITGLGWGNRSDEPRYRALSLLAHGIAAAGNAGKLIWYGVNPLALNVAQWAMLGRKIVQKIQTPAASDVLVGQHAANLVTIETGWANLGLDVSSSFEA